MDKPHEMIINIKVYDISGKKLISEKTSSDYLEVNLTNYCPGIYIVKIFTNTETLTKKIIKY